MAAVLAKGTTIINNAAIEPEITRTSAEFLIRMGAKIDGLDTSTLAIEGVDELKPAEVETIYDRIEAGTMLIASAITRGKITLKNINTRLMSSVVSKPEDSGWRILIWR